jgi:hypothetical protein
VTMRQLKVLKSTIYLSEMCIHKLSISNGSRPPLQVWVLVITKRSPIIWSLSSIYPNYHFGYCSINSSQPVQIGQVVSRLSSKSSCTFL